MKRKPFVALAAVAVLVWAADARARELTSQEISNLNGWMNTINTSGSSTAKTSVKDYIQNLGTVPGNVWANYFTGYFTTNLMKEPMAEFLKNDPLDQNRSVDYRRKFQAGAVMGAASRVTTRIGSNVFSLGTSMNTSCTIREDVLQALQVLDSAAFQKPFVDMNDTMRDLFYSNMVTLFTVTETDLLHSVVYSSQTGTSATQPWAGPIRASLLMAISGIALPSTTVHDMPEDFDIFEFAGMCMDFYSVLLLDNNVMQDPDDYRALMVWDLLSALGNGRELPEAIAIKDEIGNICPQVGGLSYIPTVRGAAAAGLGCNLSNLGAANHSDEDDVGTSNARCITYIGVNIREHEIGEVIRKPFPGTESNWPESNTTDGYDGFCTILAHEVSHRVDPDAKQARRNDLIAAACNDKLQYLRSGHSFCGSGSGSLCGQNCTTGPGEFYASIANMYYPDTVKTLDVARKRFACVEKDGHTHAQPINQFLFFADSLSGSGSFSGITHEITQVYNSMYYVPGGNGPTDELQLCNMDAQPAKITRNTNGCITSFTFPVGHCSVNTSTLCYENANCPSGQTCSAGPKYTFGVDSSCNVTSISPGISCN